MNQEDFLKIAKSILDNIDDFYYCWVEIAWECYTLWRCKEMYESLTWKNACKDLYNTLYKKNNDYSQEHDAFYNFELCNDFWVSTNKWLKVRMCDKVSRIDTLTERNWEHLVDNESLHDSWLDLMGYICIYTIYNDFYWEF